MPFIANTDEQRDEMLGIIGVKSVDDLFADIPPSLRCKELNIRPGLSELDVRQHMLGLAEQNNTTPICFLGGGVYDHFIPAAVDALTLRSEFYTAYTPYQAEISQGTLQAIYEYQSAISRLTGMDVSNASLYDGGTALCESIMMAVRITQRRQIIIDDSLNPIYRKVVQTYLQNQNINLVVAPSIKGLPCRNAILKQMNDLTAALVVQSPNFFGCIDDCTDLADIAHKNGSLLINVTYPISLGIIKPPGQMNADIVVGEGQSLGIPLSFGGPYLGFMATRNSFVRKMPGRIVGRTNDRTGKQGFVLTLQAREQHIRRENATSNICTNQGLCAIRAIIYLSLLGKHGLVNLSRACAQKAEYARTRLLKIPGVTMKFPERNFFNEFVLNLPISAENVAEKLLKQGLMAGLPLGRYWPEMDTCLLVAVTEKRTQEDIDSLAYAMESVL